MLHFLLIFSSVGLNAQTVHGRAFAFIQYSGLNKSFVGIFTHFSAESVYLTHKMSFCSSAYAWIARHIGNGIHIYNKHNGGRTEPGGCKSGFAAGMPSADYGYLAECRYCILYIYKCHINRYFIFYSVYRALQSGLSLFERVCMTHICYYRIRVCVYFAHVKHIFYLLRKLCKTSFFFYGKRNDGFDFLLYIFFINTFLKLIFIYERNSIFAV